MNIAVFAIDYNPPWDEGTKKIARIVVQYLESQGDKVIVITNDLIAKSRILPNAVRKIRILKQLETIYIYKKIINTNQIDVLFKVVQAGPFFAVKPYLYEKILRKPYYLYVSSISEGKGFYRFLLNQKRVLVGGNYLKRYFTGGHLMYPIIDPSKTGEVLSHDYHKKRNASDKKIILFLGAFQKERGVEILIKAVARLKIKNDIRLVLAWNGVGELIDTIKNIIKQERIEDIVSIIGSSDITDLYSAAHIVVIPRLVGTDFDKKMFFPLRIIESMSFGKPLVVSDVYDLATVIKGCGIAPKPGSIEELGSAIERLCSDQDFYESCSKECIKQFREKYHPLINLKKIYEVIHGLN